MTKFIPNIQQVLTPARVQKVKVPATEARAITNLPEAGTRIRATLGETVIVGTLSATQPSSLSMGDWPGIVVDIEPLPGEEVDAFLQAVITLRFSNGWEFELLDTVPDDARELTAEVVPA